MCVILRVDYLFAIGLDYAYSRRRHRPFTYSNGRWQQVGPGEVIYLRIAQNYYENLKKTTTKLQQTKTYIYSNSVSAAITTLNIDFM